MTYYSDLSDYSYSAHALPMLNVGWLAAGHEFEKGEVAREIFDALLMLADQQRNIMRGLHYCDFCGEESPIRMVAPVVDGSVWLGMGEIRIRSLEGTVYSAPSLVLHYIQAHNYRPPEEFLEAVRTGQEAGPEPGNP